MKAKRKKKVPTNEILIGLSEQLAEIKSDITEALVVWHKLVESEQSLSIFREDKKKGLDYSELDARISHYTVECNKRAEKLMDLYNKITQKLGSSKLLLDIPFKRLKKDYPDL
jgi:hypothetical protein